MSSIEQYVSNVLVIFFFRLLRQQIFYVPFALSVGLLCLTTGFIFWDFGQFKHFLLAALHIDLFLLYQPTLAAHS